MAQYIPQVGYGLTGPLQTQAPLPVQSQRQPNHNDVGYVIGQIWICVPLNLIFILTSVVNNSASWINPAAGGGGGGFTTLASTSTINLDTANPGSVNTIGNALGATSLGLSAGTGGISLSTVNSAIALTSGTGAINIGTDAAVKTITIGDATGATTVSVNVGTGAANFGANATDHSTNVGSPNGVSLTTVLAGTSGIFLSAPFVVLPGPVHLYTGAGAPAGGLALNVGDLYVNTAANLPTNRLYIASGAGVWTNVTCAG